MAKSGLPLMRFFCLLATLSLTLSQLSVAQDGSRLAPLAEGLGENPEPFVVQISEYRLEPSQDPALTVEEIVQSLTAASGEDPPELLETVRLSVIGGLESMVQFGRQTAVTVGRTTTGRGSSSRVTRSLEVGTLVRATVAAKEEEALVRLEYEASRFEGEGTEDSPPDLVTTRVQTTQLVKLGEPRLIAGTSAGQTSLLLLTVSR